MQGIAKRVPLSEFVVQGMGQQGMKAITLAVGDSVAAMHAFSFTGNISHLNNLCVHLV